MTLPLYSEGDDRSRGLAPAAPQHRVTRPSDRASFAVSPLRAGTDWRGALLDDGTDTFNRVCTHIAIIMLGGLLAMYLETL